MTAAELYAIVRPQMTSECSVSARVPPWGGLHLCVVRYATAKSGWAAMPLYAMHEVGPDTDIPALIERIKGQLRS